MWSNKNLKETIASARQWAVTQFAGAGFEMPDVEARALLSGLLKCSSTNLLLRLDEFLDDDFVDQYKTFVNRRLKHEPVAYIVGVKNFMGFDFEVTPQVLIPRPETELLVEDILMEFRDSGIADPVVLDVGTGSGCLAVSLGCFLPKSQIYACDISPQALEIAKKNAIKHDVPIYFFLGDLLKETPPDLKGAFDMIASNPPYIVSSIIPQLQPELFHEPQLALDGGHDGLRVLCRLIEQSYSFLKPNGLLEIEIGHDQGESVRKLFEKAGFEKVTILKDYSGYDRIAKGRKRGSI